MIKGMLLINLERAQFGLLTLLFVSETGVSTAGKKVQYHIYIYTISWWLHKPPSWWKKGGLLFHSLLHVSSHHTSSYLWPDSFWTSINTSISPFHPGIWYHVNFLDLHVLQTTMWHLICKLGNDFKHSSSTKSIQNILPNHDFFFETTRQRLSRLPSYPRSELQKDTISSNRSNQWLILVPLKGGRWHIIPQLAVYTTYIPLIVLAFWGVIYSLPPFTGTRNYHWSKFEKNTS